MGSMGWMVRPLMGNGNGEILGDDQARTPVEEDVCFTCYMNLNRVI